MPPRTLEQALDFVCTDIKPDVLVWLGDNSNHQFWETDIEEHDEFTHKIADIINSKLKNCEGLDTVVVPIIGNHELKPMDSHDFSKKNYPMIHNVLDKMADFFEMWLTKEELDHFREHGYYTKIIKKNLRILCLFTATDLMSNYTNWNQEFDPGNQ
jgi:3',5'-cyclic AMP phosphodiesterase CpdA